MAKVSAWRQYKALLAKDVRQEIRTREMLVSMGVYAVLVLTVYGAALAQVGDRLQVVSFAAGLLWALIVFTSLLGLNRSFGRETETGCLDGILLAPVDRAVVFLAKATTNLLFLLIVEVVVVPLFFLFFLSGLAILFIPVVFPLLYACVSATGVAFMGVEGTFGTFWTSCGIALGYDVVMIAAAWGLYEFVVSA